MVRYITGWWSLTALVCICASSVTCSSKKADDRVVDDTDIDTGTQADAGSAPPPDGGRGTDTAGFSDTDTVVVPDLNVDKGRIGDNIFNDDQLLSYYITISDGEYKKLMDMSTLTEEWRVNKDRYVTVGLRVGETDLPAVGLRFKGDWSIISCVINGERQSRVEPVFGNIDVCQRFSLKLDFNEYNDTYRLDGLKKLNLHAMSTDPSKMHERLGYSLFRDMDILAPRTVHAKVFINGEYHGLFVAVEQVDGRFTANRRPSHGDGNLFKQIWPAEDTDEDEIANALKSNDDPTTVDVSDFISFGEAVAEASDAGFSQAVGPYLDFDYLARYLVVDRAITNFDGILSFYEGMGNHNYYWYHDEESGQFMLIPWDLDKTFMVPEPNFWFDNFGEATSALIPQCSPANLPNWNVVSAGCDWRICSFDSLGSEYRLTPHDCDPLIAQLRDEIYARQAELAQAFVEGPFSQANVVEKLDRWESQITEALQEDDMVDLAAVQAAINELKSNIPVLQNNLTLIMGGLVYE